MMFAELMRRSVGDVEITPHPYVRVAGGGYGRYVSYEQAIRLLELLTRR